MNRGIIGPGEVADRFHAPAVKNVNGLFLTSVMGNNLERTIAFAKKHNVENVYGHDSINDFFHSIDTVLIATPDEYHVPLAIQAAKAGKHVIIEKPLGLSTKEFPSLLAALQQSRTLACVGYHLRHHAGHQILYDKVHAGDLGMLQAIRIHWTYDFTSHAGWRPSSQWWALGTLGTHCADIARWLLGDGLPEHLSLLTTNSYYGKNDESAFLSFQLNGVQVMVYNSVLYKSPFQVDIYGSKTSAHATGTLGPRGGGSIVIGDKVLPFVQKDPYEMQLRAFKSLIETGVGKHLAMVDDGIWNVTLLEEAANNEGRTISENSRHTFF